MARISRAGERDTAKEGARKEFKEVGKGERVAKERRSR